MNTSSVGSGGPSLSAHAVRGSFFNTGQWVVNKAVTALAMLVVARCMLPDEYGVAVQALAVSQFLVVLTPVVVGDVLIAHPARFELLAPSARFLAISMGALMTVFGFCAIPAVLALYDTYPREWLGGLLALLAVRPLLDGLMVVPMSRIRAALSYGRIAAVDGSVQFAMTTLSVLMALIGARGASLVVPQVAGTGIRAAIYSRLGSKPQAGRVHRATVRLLMRFLIPAALGQYVHNVVVLLEPLVLGLVAGREQVGYFGFAFMLAAQANGLVAYQLGVVLQPIFGRLADDPMRRALGYLKAQRVLGAVCVPISVTQAVLAEPLFRVAFDPKWLPAAAVFQIVSIGQSFYFSVGPSIAMLRSQRRFGTFLAWQLAQGAVSIPIFAWAADAGGAVGTALASAAVWAAGAPVALWMCVRGEGAPGPAAVVLVFLRPWAASALPGLLGWYAVGQLGAHGVAGDALSLSVLGPSVLGVSVVLSLAIDPLARGTALQLGAGVRARLRRRP